MTHPHAKIIGGIFFLSLFFFWANNQNILQYSRRCFVYLYTCVRCACVFVRFQQFVIHTVLKMPWISEYTINGMI